MRFRKDRDDVIQELLAEAEAGFVCEDSAVGSYFSLCTGPKTCNAYSLSDEFRRKLSCSTSTCLPLHGLHAYQLSVAMTASNYITERYISRLLSCAIEEIPALAYPSGFSVTAEERILIVDALCKKSSTSYPGIGQANFWNNFDTPMFNFLIDHCMWHVRVREGTMMYNSS